MSKKCISLALGILMSALLFTGCSGTFLSGSKQDKDRTLVLSIWDAENQEIYKTLAQDYAKEHPGLTIQVQVVEEKYTDMLIKSLSEKETDVFAVPADELQNVIDTGKMMELEKSKLLPNDYDHSLLQIGTRDEHLWAIPIMGSIPVVCFNLADYETCKLAVAQTLSDFIVNCSILQENGLNPFALATDNNGKYDVADFVEGILANGPRDTSLLSDGKFFAVNTELDSGFIDIIGLANELNISDMLGNKEDCPQGHQALLEEFVQGKYSMIACDTNDIKTLRALDSNFGFGYFAMPGSNATATGVFKADIMLGIAKNTHAKSDAEGFIKYLLAETNQAQLCDVTLGIPALNNVKLADSDLSKALALLDPAEVKQPSLFQRISPADKSVCLNNLDLAFAGSIGSMDVFMRDWTEKIKSSSEDIK